MFKDLFDFVATNNKNETVEKTFDDPRRRRSGDPALDTSGLLRHAALLSGAADTYRRTFSTDL
jgi:hypothetical protein